VERGESRGIEKRRKKAVRRWRSEEEEE